MIKVKCLDCDKILEEYSIYECYDEYGTDAIWDDNTKNWICGDCNNERKEWS